MSTAFEKISQGLKEAIAHASGEEVAGVVIHNVAKAASEPEKATPRKAAMPFRVESSNDAALAHL